MSSTGPSAFSQILSSQELPLIVGGQAVNLWAEIYAGRIPELEEFMPFTSKDADIYGTRELAGVLARRAGWECEFPSQRDSVMVARLVKASPVAGQPSLTIEVLNEVNGLTEADLNINTIVQLGDGARYRIPSPQVLLKAKIYNLVSLVADDRPQDLKHTRMLMHIVPQRLNELFACFREGEITGGNLLGAVNYTGKVVLAPHAGNAARSHALDFRQVFPASLRLTGPEVVRTGINEAEQRLVEMNGYRPREPK